MTAGSRKRVFQALGLLRHFQESGRQADAMRLAGRLAIEAPGSPDVQFALATVAEDGGDLRRAVTHYERAVALKPGYFEAWINLGACQEELGDFAGAEAALRNAIALDRRSAIAHYNLALALSGLGRFEEAVAALEETVRLDPSLAEAHYNLGNALWRAGRASAAAESYKRAIALQPNHVMATASLGAALKALGRIEESLAAFDCAVKLAPDEPRARKGRAMSLLLLGRFPEGWSEFEWRWRLGDFSSPQRNYPTPPWDGGPLAGKRILLHWEQGLGDTIQFIRYAALAKRLGATVIAEVQPKLRRLLAGVEGIDTLVATGDELPPFDCHAPLMSLPRLLGTTLENIPAPLGYLKAEPTLAEKWRQRLATMPRPWVGLAWRGERRHTEDQFRSMPIEALAPLVEGHVASFVSLQQASEDDKIARAGLASRIRSFAAEMDQGPDAFIDTAAVIANLDLVITVDTSIAHLAAALGRPTWILLHAGPDWRWLKEGSRSPWYPSVRLFRQRALGDWDGVAREVRAAFSSTFAAAPGTGDVR